MPKKIWDTSKSKYVKTPDKINTFLEEYNELCKKHNLSLSHEDSHGGFEIEEYTEHNIDWVKNCNMNIADEEGA